jgi:hypothetical protein
MGNGISLTTFAERIDGQLSEEVRVTSGVPQRSVSSSVLFLVYVTDIWKNSLTDGFSQMIV